MALGQSADARRAGWAAALMSSPFPPALPPSGTTTILPAIGQRDPALQVLAQELIKALQGLIGATQNNLTGREASGDLQGIYPGPMIVIQTHLVAPLPVGQGGTGNTTGAPSGPAGGDLIGTFPNPQVASTHLLAPLPIAQGGTGNTTGAPSGTAGGDLSGSFPNPQVVATHLAAALPVAQGGTSLTTGNSGGILAFNGAASIISSAALTQFALLLGGGAGAAPTTLASLGTTTTLLHGNAAGAPTFGQVVTGDIANSAVTYAKLQNESASTLLGNPTGGPIAPEEITLAATLSFSGTTLGLVIPVAIASGGTGSTTAAGALTNLGALPIAGGTITGSLTVNGNETVGGNLSFSTSGDGISGITNASNAAAGIVGEVITASATGVAMVSGTFTNVTQITLTAGDWDVWGHVALIPAGTTTISQIATAISDASASYPGHDDISSTLLVASFTTGNPQVFNTGTARRNINASRSVFLVAGPTFGVSTMTADGTIFARRIR